MRLSEAILLGDSLKKSDPFTWLSKDGSCGCAIGGAMLAAGITAEEWADSAACMPCYFGLAREMWPFLDEKVESEISRMYAQVAKGELALEQLCDYVRSVEPEEAPEQAEVLAEKKELEIGALGNEG
jgi:hypothetical protein